MLVSGLMGAAGTDPTTSVTTSTGGVTRTASGYCLMAARSIFCGDGRADVRATRVARMNEVCIMTEMNTRVDQRAKEVEIAQEAKRVRGLRTVEETIGSA